MSTYLSGNPTYLPQIQPFKPNLNLYAGVLQMKQSKFDTAHKQLSSLYGSLLNSKMLREDTNASRDEYFKSIDGEIKKLANVDLSLSQNVDGAESLFNGLTDNDAIVKDMSFTKSYQNQLQRAESLRMITDPKKGGGQYWEEGVEALHMKAQEFANADIDSAMGMSAPKYTSYVDVTGKAMAIAKEMGFENAKFDTVTNEWIVTEKGGDKIIPSLMAVFQGQLGNDPAIKEMYQTKAYVGRKKWIASNTEEYGSEEAATEAYVKKVNTEFYKAMGSKKEDIELQNKYLEERINNKKESLEDWEIKTGNSSYEESQKQISALASNTQAIEYIETEIASHDNVNRLQNLKGIAESMDNTYSGLLMYNDFSNSAKAYADGHYERTVDVNQWGLERQKHAWSKELKAIEHANAVDRIKLKAGLDATAAKKKADSEASLGDDLDLVKTNPDKVAGVDAEEGSVNRQITEADNKLSKEILNSRSSQLQKMFAIVDDGGESSTELKRNMNLNIGYARLEELKKDGSPESMRKYTSLSNELRDYKKTDKKYVTNKFYDRFGKTLSYNSIKKVYDYSKGHTAGFLKTNAKSIDDYSNFMATQELIEEKSKNITDLRVATTQYKRDALRTLAEQPGLSDELRELIVDPKNESFILDSQGNFKNASHSSIELAIRDGMNAAKKGSKNNIPLSKAEYKIVKSDSPFNKETSLDLLGYKSTNGKLYKTEKEATDASKSQIKQHYLKSKVEVKNRKTGEKETLLYSDIVNADGDLKDKYKGSGIKFKDSYLEQKRLKYFKALGSFTEESTMAIGGLSRKYNLDRDVVTGEDSKAGLNKELIKAMDSVKKKGSASYNYIDGLIGLGSEVPKDFSFNINPSMKDPESKGYEYHKGVKEVIKDYNDNKDNGGAELLLSDEGSELSSHINDIYVDLISMKKYSTIRMGYHAQESKTSDLSMSIPDDIAKKYLTADEMATFKKDRPTLKIRINDNVATNSFYNSTKVKPQDLTHKMRGNVTKIDPKFNTIFKGQVDSHDGGFLAHGTLKDIDENGNVIEVPVRQFYPGTSYDVSSAVKSFEGMLSGYANY